MGFEYIEKIGISIHHIFITVRKQSCGKVIFYTLHPDRHPPGQTPPLGKHPPGKTLPWADTPPGQTHPLGTPLAQCMLGYTPPA